jgi:hypothetical protein
VLKRDWVPPIEFRKMMEKKLWNLLVSCKTNLPVSFLSRETNIIPS